MFERCTTFSLIVNPRLWGMGGDELVKRVFLNYLEDIASGMDFAGPATAAILVTTGNLIFTFLDAHDLELFASEVESLYNEGEWLSND